MRSLLDTPSGGEFEVLRALYLARGYAGAKVIPSRLLRHLPPHTDLDEVADILEGESGTYVATSAGKYGLTAAGIARTRAHKPRHGKIPVS